MSLASLGAGLAAAADGDSRKALERYRRGVDALRTERFAQAEADFQAATRYRRLLVPAHYGLGLARMAQRDYSAALTAFLAAREAHAEMAALLRSDPKRLERRDDVEGLSDGFRRASWRRGSRSELNLGSLQRRIAEMGEHGAGGPVSADPPPEISLSIGSARFRLGALDEAEREYRAALRGDASFGEAHNNLAVILMMTGRLDEAQRHLDRAEASGFDVDPRFRGDLAARRQRPSATSP